MATLDPSQVAALLNEELEKERNARIELERTRDALISEFSRANTSDEILTVAQKGIKDLLPDAIITMGILMKHAESESVRASISKYVTETVISGKVEGEGNSEIKNLLQQLANNDPAPTLPNS